MTPALELDQVSRTYGAGRTQVVALDRVSLSVAKGELVSVMGSSGSGKSTLLTLAGGLDVPSSGRVSVDGVDLAGPPPWRPIARLLPAAALSEALDAALSPPASLAPGPWAVLAAWAVAAPALAAWRFRWE